MPFSARIAPFALLAHPRVAAPRGGMVASATQVSRKTCTYIAVGHCVVWFQVPSVTPYNSFLIHRYRNMHNYNQIHHYCYENVRNLFPSERISRDCSLAWAAVHLCRGLWLSPPSPSSVTSCYPLHLGRSYSRGQSGGRVGTYRQMLPQRIR